MSFCCESLQTITRFACLDTCLASLMWLCQPTPEVEQGIMKPQQHVCLAQCSYVFLIPRLLTQYQ